MAEILEGVRATRMELLKMVKRVAMAEKGHKLLKEKRDSLLTELFAIVGEVKKAQEAVEKTLAHAYKDLLIAQTILGTDELHQISNITGQDISLRSASRNIMGVHVPALEMDEATRSVIQRGYGLVRTSSKVDEAAKAFEESLQLIAKLAEIEETVRRLAREIERTKRRVNALEYFIIPKLKATVKYIRMRLDEVARDDFIRLKRIKAILEKKGEKGTQEGG